MADVVGYFPATLAVDSSTGTRQRNAKAQVFAMTDVAFATPLDITDVADVPYTANEIEANSDGIFPEFKTVSGEYQVIVKSGQALTPITSIGVQTQAAVDAATTATVSATTAQQAKDSAEQAAAGALEALSQMAAKTGWGGMWVSGQLYHRNDVVQRGNELWIALNETSSDPWTTPSMWQFFSFALTQGQVDQKYSSQGEAYFYAKGVKADGVTNDTAALNAAIDALPTYSAFGNVTNVLIIPAGRVIYNGTRVFNGRTLIRGSGKYISLIYSTTSVAGDMFTFNATNSGVEYLTIGGNGAMKRAGSALVWNAQYPWVLNVRVENVASDGFVVGDTSGAIGAKFYGADVRDVDGIGIHVKHVDSTDGQFTACDIGRAGATGFKAAAAGTQLDMVHAWACGSIVGGSNGPASGIWLAAAGCAATNWVSETNVGFGLYVGTSAARGCVVSSGMGWGNGAGGVALVGASYTVVSSNRISNNGAKNVNGSSSDVFAGIHVDAASFNKIIGNVIYDDATKLDPATYPNGRVILSTVDATTNPPTVTPAGTVADAGDLITITAHGAQPGDLIAFGILTPTTTGLSSGTPYYVKTVPTADTLTVSTTVGGPTVPILADGSIERVYFKVKYPSFGRAAGARLQSYAIGERNAADNNTYIGNTGLAADHRSGAYLFVGANNKYGLNDFGATDEPPATFGGLTVGSNAAQNPVVRVKGAAGSVRRLAFATANLDRWFVQANISAETGSNMGSDLDIVARNDSGNALSTPVSIRRADGRVSLAAPVKLFASATTGRPTAGSVGVGAMMFDTTLGKPIWSDGTNWKDATGATV